MLCRSMEHGVQEMTDHILAHMQRCPLTIVQAARLLEIDADTAPAGGTSNGGVGAAGSATGSGPEVAQQLQELRQRALAALEAMPFDEQARRLAACCVRRLQFPCFDACT